MEADADFNEEGARETRLRPDFFTGHRNVIIIMLIILYDSYELFRSQNRIKPEDVWGHALFDSVFRPILNKE